MHGVTVTELIQRNHFKNLTPEINTDEIIISAPDINRPALPLTGFFAHFDKRATAGHRQCRDRVHRPHGRRAAGRNL